MLCLLSPIFAWIPPQDFDLISEASLKHVWQISLTSHLWIQLELFVAVPSQEQNDSTTWRRHMPWSLCIFVPLSSFQIQHFLQKNQSWATRVEPQDNSVETPTGHFGTSKQCRWFALVQASGEKWSSRNRNFWNLQKNWGPICIPWSVIPAIVFFLWKFAKPLLPVVPLGGLGRSVAGFFSADISLTYCQKVGEFPGSYVWSEKLFPDS